VTIALLVGAVEGHTFREPVDNHREHQPNQTAQTNLVSSDTACFRRKLERPGKLQQ
jgi:hypothetical protein